MLTKKKNEKKTQRNMNRKSKWTKKTKKKKTICLIDSEKKNVNGVHYCKINCSLLKKLIDI